MTNYAQIERQALADLFTEVGPDAPTICEGWTTADLAAHLVVRERRPDGAIGILVSPFAGYAEKVRKAARDANRWPALVDKVRTGPPLALKLLDEPVNTVEYLIHHEDVRRAVPGWEPRRLDADEEAALWSRLRLLGRALFRKAPAAVTLVSPDHGTLSVHGGADEVAVKGPPSELLLFGFGRQAHARVELDGPADAVERLRNGPLGL